MRFAPIFLALVLTLSGCGIRGPLYLPDQAPAKPKSETPPQSKQAQGQEQK